MCSLSHAPAAGTHYNLAAALQSESRLPEALHNARRAVALRSEFAQAEALIGDLLQSMGRNEEAWEQWQVAGGSARASRNQSALVSIDPANLASDRELRLEDGTTLTTASLSQRPLVSTVHGLLSRADAAEIIGLAEGRLKESLVTGTVDEQQSLRNSSTAWLKIRQFAAVLRLAERVAVLLGRDASTFPEQLEDMQVVAYAPGQEFRLHHDSTSIQPRVCTVLVYLTKVVPGSGGTWFPLVGAQPLGVDESAHSLIRAHSSANPMDTGLVHYASLVGDAVVFLNHQVDDQRKLDPAAIHAGLPVQLGSPIKWVANLWIRA